MKLTFLIVISILGQLFLTSFSPVIAADASCNVQQSTPSSQLQTQTNLSDPGCAYQSLGPLISLLLTLAIMAGAITAMVFLIIGAIKWGTSKGSPEATKEARNTMIYAIIGLILLGLTYVFIVFFNNILPHQPIPASCIAGGEGCPSSQ